MVGTSATVDFRDRRLSTAARSAGTVRAILGEGDIFALRSSELAGCMFGLAERRDQISIKTGSGARSKHRCFAAAEFSRSSERCADYSPRSWCSLSAIHH
jgi:hypothetical protein